MDDTKIQEILDSLPPRVLRSRLEPYAKLIHEMRQRGFTYRAIAQVLTEKCQTPVNPGSIHDFVRVRSKAKAKIAKKETQSITAIVEVPTPSTSTQPKPYDKEEAWKKIEAVRNRPLPEENKRVFFYDENEPLKPISTKNKTE